MVFTKFSDHFVYKGQINTEKAVKIGLVEFFWRFEDGQKTFFGPTFFRKNFQSF